MKPLFFTIINKWYLMSPLAKRVVLALFFSVSGTAGAKALQLFCSILVSRILGRDIYGEYAMVNSTVLLFVVFAGAGVEATLTRYVALYRDKQNAVGKIIGTISICVICFSAVICTFFFCFSNQLSFWLCGTGTLTPYFRLTTFTIFSTVLAAIGRSVLVGFEKYRIVAKVEILSMAPYVGITVVITWLFHIYGAIFSLLILHIIRFIAFGFICIKQFQDNHILLEFRADREIGKILTNFTIPAFAASLFVVPINWALNSMITRSFGFAELAVYAVAMQWHMMITYVPAQMNQLRPIYASLYAEEKLDELNNLLKKTTLSSVIMVIPFVLICAVFGRLILSIYGEDYVSGYFIFIVILTTMVPYSVQMQIGSYLQAIGMMWSGFALNIIWALISLVGARLLMHLGGVGFAIAYFISYFIHCILSWILVDVLNKKRVSSEKNYR